MSWAVPTDASPALPERPSLTSQQSSSLPSTPYQQPRHIPARSSSRSPPRNSSPCSAHSELNHILPPIRKHHGCKYETGMAHFRRRMPYSLGGELLPDEPGPLKDHLDPEDDERLSHGMTELYNSLLPSEESEQRRSRFVRKLEDLLNERWPGNDIKVHVFGSSGNKLCSSDSDVDICITTSLKSLERVCLLAEFLAKSGMERVVCVSDAKVPIVKIWDPELRVACDMNVNNTTALENTRMIKTYVEVDKRARQLAMIVKHWTKRRILNDAALGGTLSSYTWICLIINFLQTRSPPILPSLQRRASQRNDTLSDGPSFDDDLDNLAGFGAENNSSLGTLLFQFFRYYGHEVDYESNVMSVREGCLISKEEKRWHLLQNNRLCVEEPFTTSRNLGNTADDTSFRGLHMELRRAFSLVAEGKLDECCEQYEFPPEEERTWERPPPQRRPIIAPVPPLTSRGGRGGARGARRSSNLNRGAESNRRTSSSANKQGNSRNANPAFTAEIALQAQQAQTLLHDHLFQQIQMLQAQEQELRLQLHNQTVMNGRTLPTLVRPYVQTAYPQQDGTTSGASDEASRTRSGTVNHPPLSAPMRPVYYSNQSYIPVPFPPVQSTHTNPPSPSIPPGTPEVRRSHRRSSAASGSPRGNLRAQSQPARPQSSSVSQSFGRNAFNTPGHPDGSQVSSLQNDETQESPQETPVDGGPFALPNGVPIFPKTAYANENFHPEYIGYYVGDSHQLQAGYHNSTTPTSFPGTSSFHVHANGVPAYSNRSPDSRQAGFTSRKPTSNLVSQIPDTHPSEQRPLNRSKTAPDCGLLIVDGSHSTRDSRQPSVADSQDNPYLSHSAPCSNDGASTTPVGRPGYSSQYFHEQANYDNVPGALYEESRGQLPLSDQMDGFDLQPKARSAGINGHLGRVETLSERLQRFQLSGPDVNGESHGKSGLHPYWNSMRNVHATDNNGIAWPEQALSSNKPARSPTMINASKEQFVASSSPAVKHRVNGVIETDNANGVNSQKTLLKARQGPSNSPSTKASDQKEKHPPPALRKPNGVHHHNPNNNNNHNNNGGRSQAPANPSGWQTTKRKSRKGARPQPQNGGAEPLPTDESLRKGG